MLPRILVENLIVGIKHHEIKYQKYPVVGIIVWNQQFYLVEN